MADNQVSAEWDSDAGDASAIAHQEKAQKTDLPNASIRNHLPYLALLLAIALAILLPGINTLPLTDRDEALYVQASRQMLETGDWVDIRFQEDPRYKKPVGIYWLQGLAATVTGGGAQSPLWVFRLPSLIGAVLTALFTYAIAARISGRQAGLTAGILAAATIELAFEARIGKTDAMLAATIVAAQFGLLCTYLDPDRKQVLWRNGLFWLAMGLGTLIKGPVAPMIAAFTILGLTATERNFSLIRALSPIRGVIAYLLVVLPWLLAIGWISKGAFFQESVGHDMLGKITTGQESHGAPPGTYLLVALGTFWPLSIFASLAFVYAWNKRKDAAIRFLFFWAVPAWLVFELVATKLPNYILPMMPALAVLTGIALAEGGLKTANRWFRFTYLGLAAGALLLGGGLNILFFQVQGKVHWLGLGLSVLAIALATLSTVWMMQNRLRYGFSALTGAVVTLYIMGYALLMPDARNLWLSDRIAEAITRHTTCNEPLKLVAGYAEPSLVFRIGTQVRRLSGEQAAEAFYAAPCAIAAVTSTELTPFMEKLQTLGGTAQDQETISARNLNGLKLQTVHILTKAP